VLEGNNPRFPWKPSTTMLTYRLADIARIAAMRVRFFGHRCLSPTRV
jgi:hypothetical protein